MAISGSINAQLNITDQQIVQIATVNVGPNKEVSLTIENGTGAGQANLAWGQIRTLSGSSEDLDLTSLTNYAAATVGFASLVAVFLVNISTSNEVTMKTDITNGCTSFLNGELKLRRAASGKPSFALIAQGDATGSAVTAGTGDQVRIVGTSGQSYALIFVGRTI